MKQYTISISDAQDKALQHVVFSVQEWMENFIFSRANSAINDIAQAEIDRKLQAGETVSGTKEEIVLAANIKTAAERTVELEAEIAARQAQE